MLNNLLSLIFREMRSLLEHCAATALSSKLVARHKEFFSKMVVDAVLHLDELLPLNMIGMKKIQGGALEVTFVLYCSHRFKWPQGLVLTPLSKVLYILEYSWLFEEYHFSSCFPQVHLKFWE